MRRFGTAAMQRARRELSRERSRPAPPPPRRGRLALAGVALFAAGLLLPPPQVPLAAHIHEHVVEWRAYE